MQYFNTLSQYNHQWLTGDTLRYSRYWYRDSPFTLRFGMFFNPDSVEFNDLSSRVLYISYPPGAVLPIYLLSEITNSEPSVGMINAYNLFNHYMIALFLALMVFLFLRQLGFADLKAFILSLIPVLVILLTPAGLYWHQNVFFVDQAVIMPIVLFIFLEVARKDIANKRARIGVDVAQVLIFFYGMLTDWLFFFFALAVFVKRVFLGELGKTFRERAVKSFRYWLPAVAAMALFAIQLSVLGGWGQLFDKFLFRSGFGAGGEEAAEGFFEAFWSNHVAQGFGSAAVVFLWGSLAVLLLVLVYTLYLRVKGRAIGSEVKQVLALASVMLLPCFLQVYLFRNHSAIHSFSSLKFELPLATVTFVLIPLLVYFSARDFLAERKNEPGRLREIVRSKAKEIALALVLLPLLLASIYVALLSPRMLSLFPPPQDYSLEKLVEECAEYEDVLFSFQYEIPANPPQQLALAMKRMYYVESFEAILEKVAGIEGEYTIGILVIEGWPMPEVAGMEALYEGDFATTSKGDLRLYWLSKEELLEVLNGTPE
ncbi:MAG: hypothetical protein JW854_01615 [Actinobacteria bacterium]|nr:hypothetical protein [Actinomycetota bacterium]